MKSQKTRSFSREMTCSKKCLYDDYFQKQDNNCRNNFQFVYSKPEWCPNDDSYIFRLSINDAHI